ncbi:Alkaline ceramidase 3 [Kappamyces sp. JEL0680]|nr:Alkaline ceramidase 3 [Kappamyces sp. JEL0680]
MAPFNIHRAAMGSDPKNGIGYWGPATSTGRLRWLGEENYAASFYVAEWWNTISNLNYMVLALIGVWNTWRIGGEPRDYAVYLGAVLLIGVGSFLFHMTLLYELQLSDELPMLWGTSALLYSIVNILKPERYRTGSMVLLFVYSAVITHLYITWKEPLIFQVAYGRRRRLTVGVLAFSSMVYPIHIVSHLAKRYPQLEPSLWGGLKWNVCCYLAGFAVWLLDNSFCDGLRELRGQLPWFLSPLLQGHAWWHMLTGLGGYGGGWCRLTVGAVFVQYLRQLSLGRLDVELRYMLGLYPTLVPRIKAE